MSPFATRDGGLPRTQAPPAAPPGDDSNTCALARVHENSDKFPGFDFTNRMRRVCADMCARLDELAHIRLDEVAIGFRQTRKAVAHGIQATLTPLRFEAGALSTVRHGRTWTIQRLYDRAGREMLYVLSFYLPRFLDQPLHEKLVTVLHELWHIGPEFDGDMRRHPGRCFAHSASQKQYDDWAAQLAQKWLAQQPPRELFSFLECDFPTLHQRHGRIRGLKIPTPKLIPLPAESHCPARSS